MNRRRKAFRRGQWEVQRERLRLADASPPEEFREPTPMGRVFDELAARLATMRRHWAADLGEDWAETVGDELARATRPGGVRDRTVVVYVRNPVWMAEVRRRRRSLLQGLQARYGADRVREVRLELDPGDGPGG